MNTDKELAKQASQVFVGLIAQMPEHTTQKLLDATVRLCDISDEYTDDLVIAILAAIPGQVDNACEEEDWVVRGRLRDVATELTDDLIDGWKVTLTTTVDMFGQPAQSVGLPAPGSPDANPQWWEHVQEVVHSHEANPKELQVKALQGRKGRWRAEIWVGGTLPLSSQACVHSVITGLGTRVHLAGLTAFRELVATQ